MRRACDDAPLSVSVRLCDAPYLLLVAPGKRGLPSTFPWNLFSRPTPFAAGRELASFSCSIPPSFVLSYNMPMTNTTSNWLRLGAFLRGPAESTRRCADSTSRLHGAGYRCHAHTQSEHGGPWRYTICGVSLAGMTSAALHARENANMPPRESHGRFGSIGKTGISIIGSSISSHSLTAVLVPLTTGHCSPATRHYLLRPSPAGYCLTPTVDLSRTERGPISTSGPTIIYHSVCHQTRRFLRKNQTVLPHSPPPHR